jgi:serine/threonine-protein kinase RsbW
MHFFGIKHSREISLMNVDMQENVKRLQVQSPAEMNLILEKLEDWMRVLGYGHKDLFAMKLVLHEAMVNAFKHGNRYDPRKTVRIGLLVTPTEVLVSVEDQGPGYDPQTVPDPLGDDVRDRPSGRGLFLMRVYSSWMQLEPPGNRVTLCRHRSDREAQA